MTPFEDAYDKTLEDAIKTRPSKEGWFGHAVVQKMKVPCRLSGKKKSTR